ncbi:MAG: T9SS type A sorting domain-containing protein [Saprospiraceae bacterium]|nr:T9SS type A sorting domain-containing protein [Saprospiraceae bacterium]
MKQPLLTLLALALFSPTLFAQWTQTAGPEGGLVYCVEQVGTELWAGTQGGLYISSDEGDSWQLSPDVPAVDFVSRILVYGDTVIMLVSQYDLFESEFDINVFVRTSPGGSWAIHTTPVFDWDGLAGNLFLNAYGLYTIGSGEFFKSVDLGATWTTLALPIEDNYVQKLFSDGDRIIVDSYIYDTAYVEYNIYSDDGGTTWQELPAFPSDYYYDEIFVENDLIILADYDTTIQISNDFGVTWQTVALQGPEYAYLYNIRRGSDGNLYALNSHLWRSADNGLTWEYGPADGYIASVSDMVILPDDSYLLTSNSGIYKTGPDMAQWMLSNNQLRATAVYYQYASPEGYVYASSDQGFYVTKNAGASWEKAVPDSITQQYAYVYEMLFLGDTIVAANSNGVLFSFNNGQSWVKVNPDTADYVYDIFGLEYYNNTLYVGGNKIYTTTDMGQTWQITSVPITYSNCNDLKALGGDLFGAFSDGQIMRSSDGGQNWTLLTELWTPGAGRNNRLEYINGALFALGDGDPQYSVDHGTTWFELGKQGLPIVNSWGDLPTLSNLAGLGNLLFVSVPRNGVWISGDLGQTWEAYNDGLGNLRSRHMVFADSILYLGTSTGGVWRRGNQFKSVSGTVWHDDNSNGVFDVGELPYEGAIVSAQPLHAYSTTTVTGGYNIYAEVFNDTVRASANTPYAIVTPPYYVVSQDSDSLNFGIYVIPNIVDLCITVTHMEPIRPGFDNSFVVTVKNVGTTTTSGLVRMGMPDGITYNGASPLPNQILNDTLHWNIVDLEPNAVANFTVSVNTSTTLELGSTVSYAAEVQPFDDENPNNNNSNERTEVVGSYDPNDKAVSPGPWLTPEELEAGEHLTYTIRFQNTGTYWAEIVRIVDTLSSFLDVSTIQVLSSSHPCTWTVRGPGVVEFNFPDIFLPFYEPESHGFVKFSIKPFAHLELSDKVDNTGHIYFDFNPAIVTNTVTTTIGYATATGEPKYDETLRLFPNPVFADEGVLAQWQNGPKEVVYIDFYDTKGRIVEHQKATFTNDFVRLPLDNLPSGGYILLMRSNDRSAKGKLIVIRR